MSELQRAYFDAIQRENQPEIRMLADTTQAARKVYTCDDCGEEIEVGTRYRRVVVLIDGDPEITRHHCVSQQTVCW